MLRLAIAGGNIGASALLSLLRGDANTELIGLYETKPDSPGVILARKWNIPVFEDIISFCAANPEMVINITGNSALSNEIRSASQNKIEVIEGVGARLLWEMIEKQKRARVEANKTIEDQHTIFHLITDLPEDDQMNTFLGRILEKAVELADAPAGSIALYENNEMRFVASRGLSKKFAENRAWGVIPGGLTDVILKKKEIIAVPDTLKVEYTRNNPALISEKIRSLLACPVISGDTVTGILYIDDFKPRQFSDRQKASLRILAGLIGVSIDKNWFIRKIEDLTLRASSLMEVLSEAVVTTDTAGLITVVNTRAADLLGYSKKHLQGKNFGFLIKDNLWDVIRKELDVRSFVTGYEVTLIGSDGSETDMRINGTLLRDAAGTFSGCLFTLGSREEEKALKRSIEEKKKELEDLRDNLEKKVLERTEELEKANRELEYANQLKGRFIANMSHELRTPLNSIIGFSDVLLDYTFGSLTENQERYIRNIYSSGKHLLELINNVLDIAKIEAGKYEMVYETFFIDEIIGEVINIMRSLAESKFIEFVVSMGEGISTITADRVKLKQILYNLLSNAIKFTPEGGTINISVLKEEYVNGRYTESASEPDFIKFSVQDTGIGIGPEDKERIFDEFEQAGSAFSQKYGGVGLGLALTKKLVELHGGNITVESNLGEGSTFTFHIPVSSPAAAPAETVAAMENIEAVSLHFPWMKDAAPLILVVEDDLSTTELLTLHLTQAGYKVAHAFNGEEAIEKAKSLQPFAITLDVLLPKKDGWEVLQQLKTDPITAEIPVIIHSIVDNKDLAFALGATDYLLKPLDKEALFTKLDEITLAKGKEGPCPSPCWSLNQRMR